MHYMCGGIVEKEHVTFSVLDDWTAFEKFVLGNACNNEIIFRLDFDLVEGSSNSDLRCVPLSRSEAVNVMVTITTVTLSP